LRIAIFVGAFPLVSETFIVRQITGLIDSGHEVHIFSEARPADGFPVHEEVARYHLLDRTSYTDMPLDAWMEMPVSPVYGKTWTPGSATPSWNAQRLVQALPVLARCFFYAPALAVQALQRSEFGYQTSSLSSAYRLAALCRGDKRFDAIHAHFGPIANSFRLAKPLFRAPLMATFHGYDFTSWPRENGQDCYARLWRVLDRATVNSDFSAQCVRALGCPPERIRKLPVGLDPQEFVFRERTLQPGETVRILSIGRLVEVKGYEYCLRAIAQLRQDVPQLCYMIVGDGPCRRKIEELVRELGLSDHVVLFGAQNGTEVKRCLADAHVFLLGSARAANGACEAQGLVLQEAQACGLPIVATRNGGIPESVIDGVSAFLVREADAGALGEALLRLIKQPQLWPEMGRRGRRFVEEHFSIHMLNHRLVDLYTEMVEGNRTNGH
jgi:colanic acid/amylovoran biosynthesis glycosyltransferase